MGCNNTLCVPTSSSKLIKPDILIEDISSQHFKIIKPIGKGSFGKVYLIKSKETDKEYAMKTIKIKKETDLKNDIKEVNILKGIDHPNIISFKGAFISGKEECSIVTEYAKKGDLGQILEKNSKENKYFEEKELLNWLIQCCLALSYLYDLEILHRDIKPSNIFLMEDDTIKLGDFGISKDIHIFHRTKTIAGTPLYTSPEIYLDKRYDLKIDV